MTAGVLHVLQALALMQSEEIRPLHLTGNHGFALLQAIPLRSHARSCESPALRCTAPWVENCALLAERSKHWADRLDKAEQASGGTVVSIRQFGGPPNSRAGLTACKAPSQRRSGFRSLTCASTMPP